MFRLTEQGLDFEGPLTRFGAQTLGFPRSWRAQDRLSKLNLVFTRTPIALPLIAFYQPTRPSTGCIRLPYVSRRQSVRRDCSLRRLIMRRLATRQGASAFAPAAAAQPHLWTLFVGQN